MILDIDKVKNAIDVLVLNLEPITTLGVKMELRKAGGTVYQNDVRNVMSKLVREKYLTVKSQYNYRIFEITSTIVLDSALSNVSTTRIPDIIEYTRRDTELVLGYTDSTANELKDGYWKVFSTESNIVVYVPDCYSRDIARQLLAGSFNVKFKTTRTKHSSKINF